MLWLCEQSGSFCEAKNGVGRGEREGVFADDCD